MSRYSNRSATAGSVTLNSCRKNGNTLIFWFYIKVGSKWLEFDVRDLADSAGVELPPRMTSEEMDKLGSKNYDGYEALLQRDLQATADWCEKINAVKLLQGGAA